MTQKSSQEPVTKSDFIVLEEKLTKRINQVETTLKVIDEKRNMGERDLRFRITSGALETQQQLEKTMRAEIQVAINDLVSKMEYMFASLEKRLNERITTVGDLIMVNLTKKILNHEQRIKKLEKSAQFA